MSRLRTKRSPLPTCPCVSPLFIFLSFSHLLPFPLFPPENLVWDRRPEQRLPLTRASRYAAILRANTTKATFRKLPFCKRARSALCCGPLLFCLACAWSFSLNWSSKASFKGFVAILNKFFALIFIVSFTLFVCKFNRLHPALKRVAHYFGKKWLQHCRSLIWWKLNAVWSIHLF